MNAFKKWTLSKGENEPSFTSSTYDFRANCDIGDTRTNDYPLYLLCFALGMNEDVKDVMYSIRRLSFR